VLTVREIPEAEHLAHVTQVAAHRSVSFLQTPAWGQVKGEWRRESLGWFDGERLVGSALALHRGLPGPVDLRRSLAYLPEGPVIDWATDDLGTWLTPLAAHLRRRGAFAVRIGPPVVCRRWDTAAVKAGIADPDVRRLDDLAPTERTVVGARVRSALRELGWQQQGGPGAGFAAGQPEHVFQVSLRTADGTPRTEDELLRSMNQLWRRNIKKAAKEGVEVTSVGPEEDPGTVEAALAAFHALYVHTAERDGFTPRGLPYFTTMVRALGAEDPDRIRIWSAHHDGDLVAATLAVRVGLHSWYSYGASSTHKREVRGSNAVQWAMLRDALAAGCAVYDLRGITDTLDPDDPHAGLIQFKVGTGGEAVELAGEWDLPLRPLLYRAFTTYLRRR